MKRKQYISDGKTHSNADKIRKSGNHPLYLQLAETLRQRIADKEFLAGDRFPTEADLEAESGLSRVTVRQALAMLTRAGLIERFPSRGSFVTDRSRSGSWELTSISDLVQIGKGTTTKVISWRTVTPPSAIADFFGSSDLVYRLRAVRTQGAVPLYFVENYIRLEIGEQLSIDDLRAHTVVELLHNKLLIPIAHANEEISVGYANSIMAKHLWIDVGQAVIVQRIDLIDTDGRPLQSGAGWWRSERFNRKFVLNST